MNVKKQKRTKKKKTSNFKNLVKKTKTIKENTTKVKYEKRRFNEHTGKKYNIYIFIFIFIFIYMWSNSISQNIEQY